VQNNARRPLTWAKGWAISCDFDGTITQGDAVQGLLTNFADPSWREIEAEWVEGRISARDCLARQTRLIRAEAEAVTAWVDAHPVDPQAAAFFSDCAAMGLDVCILSDGYDWVIRRVMARLGFPDTPVFANRLSPEGDGRWSVAFPGARPACPAGACKCARLEKGRLRAHIGDGRSDICVSDACDLVFAKDTLLASRQARGLASVAYRDFTDIRAALVGAEPPRPMSKPARISA
jgi:2-hydroxy-3-keto-5-methylthiopentenyl-1-phosphate phosphatase